MNEKPTEPSVAEASNGTEVGRRTWLQSLATSGLLAGSGVSLSSLGTGTARAAASRNNYEAPLEPTDAVLHGVGQGPNGGPDDYWEYVGWRKPMFYSGYVKMESESKTDSDLGPDLDKVDAFNDEYGVYVMPVISMAFREDSQAIENGNWDSVLTDIATTMDDHGRPFLMRLGHEFNGSWNNYDPDHYPGAFQRIVGIIDDNVSQEWGSMWHFSPEGDSNYMDYYPGDSYVDWFGISIFEENHMTKTLTDNFIAEADSRGKPIYVPEATPRDNDFTAGNGAWTDWFSPFIDFIDNNPGIKGFNYINWHWDDHGWNWGDVRLSQNSSIASDWENELNTDLYVHAGGEAETKAKLNISSTSDTTVPVAPSNLSSGAHTDTTVDLSWDGVSDGGSGMSHYVVYVDGSPHRRVDAGVTSVTVHGVSAGTSHDFQVAAVDSAGNESGTSGTATVTTDSASGMAADYPLDEGERSFVRDHSGNERHGVLPNDNPTWTTDSTTGGDTDTVLSFAGDGEHVDTDSDHIRGASTFTQIAWVKLDDANSDYAIAGDWGEGKNYSCWYDAANDCVAAIVRDSTGTDVKVDNTGTAPPTGEWFQVAWTYDANGSLRVYQNGSETGSTSVTGNPIGSSDADRRIGGDHGSHSNLVGDIHSLFEWTDVKSATFISDAHGTWNGSSQPSPSHRWTFDGTSFTDSVGSVGGTMNGGITTGVSGKDGDAWGFDGSDDYVAVSSDGTDLENSFSSRSYSVWIEPNSTGGTQTIYEEGGSWNGLTIRIDGDTLEAEAESGDDTEYSAVVSTSFTSTSWTHVVVTFEDGTLTLYVDKNQADSYDASFSSVNGHENDAGIGATNAGDAFGAGSTGNHYDGTLDDLRIYGTALSNGEVETLYDSYTGGDSTAPVAPSNLASPSHDTSSVDLDWDAASDTGGSGLDHYNVYVDGSKDHEVPSDTTSTTVAGRSSNMQYDFHVTAVDGAGNESGASNTVTVTTDAATSPVSRWTFDGTNATDGAGSNDGTAYGSPTTGVSGKDGDAWELDGADDRVQVADDPSLDSADFTVSAWIKTSDLSSSSQSTLVNKANWSTKGGYSILDDGQYNDVVKFRVMGSGNYYDITMPRSDVNDGNWHHVVGVKDGDTTRLYLDGTQKDTTTGTAFDASASDLAIGANPGGGNELQGDLDDVRFYDQALSGSEVDDLSNSY